MAAKDGDPTSGCSLTIKKDGNQETSFKLAPSQCAVGNMAAPYDVFISHCGQDCKRDFAVLLRRELQELAGVRCFFDERDLHPGDNAAKEMLAAMQSARIGIVILSQGFFAREWCIKELHTFVELGNLLPVFLGIGPDQLGECADANTAGWAGFCKFGIAAEDIQRVVKAAGAFTGVRLEALDGFWDKCIAQVKSAVLRQLGRLEGGPSLSAGVFLVGIDKHLTKLKRLLGVSFSLEASMDESPESVGERAALIGIKGMGGVGKTTLAKSLFDDPQVREAFGGKVCWVEVNQNPSQEQVCRMQEQILETLCDLGDLRVQVHNPSLGQADIRRRLGESKVLVFLDNVWYDLGRSQVASPDWFGPGSCVVITTRSSETIGPGGNVYELDPLDPEEALTLFSWHAFLKMGAPSSALASLARRAAPLCGGLPVVIEVVGARAATETSCKEESDTIAWWESALLVDSKLEKKVTDRLRPSYDDLQKDEKQAFVLVAGLWHGVLENFDEQAIVGKLAAALYEDERDSVARAGKRLNQLIQKSLVKRATRVQNGEEIDTVTVHDSLVELGVIIAEEERECGRWVEKRRAPNLQKDGLHWQHLVIDAADGLKVPASLFSSNEGAGCALKSVVLRGVQLPALSPGLVDCALLSLIDLKPNSETGQTANLSGLTRLQSLDLIGCKSLVALEGLSELAALQSLDLSKSSSLTALEGLSCLSFLQRLDVSWCKSLTTLEGLNWLTCLTSFEVRGCLSLNELRGLNGLTGLRSLDLSHCRSLTVVEGLSGLVNLHRLDVTRCGTLTELQGLSGLQSLRSLVVRGCSLLKTLKGLDGLIGLHSLEVKGCQCLQRIEGLSGLTGLQTLLVKGCKSLETLESFDELASLKWAEVSECETLKTLEGLGGLTGLQTLTVTHCRALTAPEGLSGLAGLQELTLKGCPSVKRLEKLDGLSSLRNLTVNGCGSLTLLEGLGALANLQKSDVIECGALTALDGFGGLVGMKSFQLSYCRSVTALESLHALSSLEDLCVSQCKALTTLRGLQGLSSLRTLQVIYCRALTELDGLGELTSLRVLDLTGCEAIAAPLKGLDDLLARSTSLQAAGCVALLASNGRQELPRSDSDAGETSQSADRDDTSADAQSDEVGAPQPSLRRPSDKDQASHAASATTGVTETLQTLGRRPRAGLPDVNLLLEGLEDVPEADENLLMAQALYIKPAGVREPHPTREKITPASLLLEGMMFNAYYPDSTEIAVLEKTLRNTLASFQPDLCEFKLDLAPVASVLVHLEVIRSSGRMTVKDLAEALMEAPEDCKRYTTINLEVDDDIFELQKKAGLWALIPFLRPEINFVLFAAVETESASGSKHVKELVIVRGKNFREDLKLKWRLCRSGDLLKKCEPVPKAALEELNVVYLIRSPESLAVVFGTSVARLAGEKVSIQWMRKMGEYGSPLTFVVPTPRTEAAGSTSIDAPGVASSDRGVPVTGPSHSQQASFIRQGIVGADSPGSGPADQPRVQPAPQVPNWRYDVFISHAGTVKELAVELENDLCGLGFNAFVDETALHPGDDADSKMVRSAKLAPIGLVLFNKDFVNRKWPMAELRLIVEAGTLLPVAVGMSHAEFEEAWRASSVAAAQFDESLFKRVARTTFVVQDSSGRERELRERVCFSVLRVFVEKVYPRLPDTARSMRHVTRALSAAQHIADMCLSNLNGEDYKEAAHWVRHLKNIQDEYLPFGAPLLPRHS